MEEQAEDAAITAAEAYEALHVPALFGQWPEAMLDAAAVAVGQRVLDVACGTGVLARAAASRVTPGGSVVGVDLDAGMLAVAARLAPKVAWRRANASTLPFPERCFDAVLSQFGLMFFVERPAAIAEMLRVLKPGGRIAVAVWGALEDNGAYSVAVELLDRLAGRAAADALRAPFALGRPGPLRDLFEAAGVAGTEVVMRPGTARFPSVRVLMEAELRGWLPLLGVRLDEAVIDRILGEAESALAAYAGADGAVVFPLQALVVSGGRP